jgi:hypothetical protein|tara:strand:- start:428 stop:703 length:276 start_codon:yes stop_codon:yes gene_type:complete
MRDVNHGTDDNLLMRGQLYNIGTSDGVQWQSLTFTGYKFINGKKIMVFRTENSQQLTINPSFHTFILEDNSYDEFGNKTLKEETNGEINAQ